VKRLRRISLHVPLALATLLLARPMTTLGFVGVGLVLIGIGLRGWAAGLLHKGVELCTSGPYQYVRHPLYLGSTIGAVGLCLLANSLWVWVIVLPAFLIVYRWQVGEEERVLARAYGDAHAAWSSRVPMLIPRLSPVAPTTPRAWSLSRLLANREANHAVMTLLLLALLYLKPHLVHWP
jgi:protein-S-isoprenylcysteine O-methyltransferase Ste14